MSKAKERALEAYPVIMHTLIPMNDDAPEIEQDCNKFHRQAYIEGYQQAEKDLLDNIWHSPDEEPEIDRKIIWESENFLGKHLDKEWKPKIDCFGRKEKWCYLADILPSRNWTRERPYSKVDYSRGYDNGYEQAEKDLMLTIEDINDIIRIYEGVLDEIESCENIYTEVLNRFKDFKERKEK